MKLFVDTGNIKEIETLAAIGIIDGVTTNPSLMAKETGDYRKNLKKICQIVQGPVSAEVVATDYAGMIREGRDLADDRRAHRRQGAVHAATASAPARRCRAKGMRVNVTLVFSADAGAARGEGGRDVRQPVRRPARRHRHDRHGPDSARSSRSIDNYRVHDRSAGRQLRHPIHIIEAARMGADICTCPAGGHRAAASSIR